LDSLRLLCELIIPTDEHSGNALDAGAEAFITCLIGENMKYYRIIAGGLMWLDCHSSAEYGLSFRGCDLSQQHEILKLLSVNEVMPDTSSISHGRIFFAFLRRRVVDAFFTSRIGLDDLHYMGSTSNEDTQPRCFTIPSDDRNAPLISLEIS